MKDIKLWSKFWNTGVGGNILLIKISVDVCAGNHGLEQWRARG